MARLKVSFIAKVGEESDDHPKALKKFLLQAIDQSGLDIELDEVEVEEID